MSQIQTIEAKEITDSRGEPTIEVTVTLDDGTRAKDSVPSGTSTGTHEAALVDVPSAIRHINQQIQPALVGMEATEQEALDRKMIELDGTENKGKLGANAILGVSLAVARAAAKAQKLPLYQYLNSLFCAISGLEQKPGLPTPMMVMFCGGKHAKETANALCIQEFLAIGSLEDGIKIWHSLEDLLKNNHITYSIGLEGAFAPEISDDEKAIALISEAIEKSGVSSNVRLGVDVAGNNCRLTSLQILEYFKKYHLFSIEDPFGEEDWAMFGQLKLELEEAKVPFLLIGDDIFSTNRKLLEKGISQIVANGIIIKPNQVGTLTEVFEVVKLSKEAKFKTIVSHRSGETEDNFIADLAVGIAADYLKSGAPIPPERMAKYSRLEAIAKELT